MIPALCLSISVLGYLQQQPPPVTPTERENFVWDGWDNLDGPSSGSPAFFKLSTDKILKSWEDAGLEFVVDPEDEGGGWVPKTYRSKIHFFVPSLDSDIDKGNGGRIYTFTTLKYRDAVRDYYQKLSEASGITSSWLFVRGNLVIQLNGQMKQSVAKKYRDALARTPKSKK